VVPDGVVVPNANLLACLLAVNCIFENCGDQDEKFKGDSLHETLGRSRCHGITGADGVRR
jgi:hypothetical protein